MHRARRVSEAERRFLIDGVEQGLRNDGRGCFDYRRVSFEMGVLPTATASCRLYAGETEVLVGVTCDMAKPSAHRPNAGCFWMSVDCAALVSASFSEGAGADDSGRQLSVLLEALCAGDDVVDRRALCVVPGLFAWEVHADIMVLRSGGNVLDSVSLALCAALSTTLLPKVDALEAVEEGEMVELRVDERPECGVAFPLRRMPLCVTVAQLQKRCLLDATIEEELCADALLCVVVDAKCSEVVGLHKVGRGLFDAALLPPMLEHCRATAVELGRQLQRELTGR